MSTLMTDARVSETLDPRLKAFCSKTSLEVFHSVATPIDFWRADPFDVSSIHQGSREVFERLLNRASRVPPPPSGAVLVLLGEAGSGKTHLMRAFRTRAHSQGLGYCGYMQMSTEISQYARYMLHNLLDGLEQQYSPDIASRTGLARLSTCLLELVPDRDKNIAISEVPGDVIEIIEDYADRLKTLDRFRDCDLNLLRVLLHLQRNEPAVKTRAMMWLRCEDMSDRDRAWLGGIAARNDDSQPMEMLRHLASVTDAVQGVPLVLLIDQLEDMANHTNSLESFRKVVDTVTSLTDQVANAIVVIACLFDYYDANVKKLTKSKIDRLENDPDRIQLNTSRNLQEIRDILSLRLACIYSELESPTTSVGDIYPYSDHHIQQLQGMPTRMILDFCRKHHERCIIEGRWVEPVLDKPADTKVVVPVKVETDAPDLDPLWNDFHTSYKAAIPDDDADLIALLARSIRSCAEELADGYHFGDPRPDSRFIEVETHKPNNVVEKLLVTACNGTAGKQLLYQLDDLDKRVGDFPVALVRTIDFPKSGVALNRIVKMTKVNGRRVVVSVADLRRMQAFEAFALAHHTRPDFTAWQKTARPLSQIKALEDILRLKQLPPSTAPTKPVSPPPPAIIDTPRPVTPPPVLVPPPPVTVPFTAPPPEIVERSPLRLGTTSGRLPQPVQMEHEVFTRHAAFLGSPGSGKTTAAMNLIEQLLLQGIPVILLDRKGDLCRYADPTAWTPPLADPAREATRVALRARLDIAVYTPGESRGRPLALPVIPPGFNDMLESERLQMAQQTAAALGSMMGMKSTSADMQMLAILTKAIEVLAAEPGAVVDIPSLRQLIRDEDDNLLAAVDGFDSKVYNKLSERIQTLWLNDGALLKGKEVLDAEALLGKGPHARAGKTRLSIISTKFLNSAARIDFWVAQLFITLNQWASKSPSGQLQAVLFCDEADCYLPAMTKPATKAPIESLLRRGRSAGLGVFLATQNPGDLDYNCRGNISTWLLGKITQTTAQAKVRPLFATCKNDPTYRLSSMPQGEFQLVIDDSVQGMKSDMSLIKSEQLTEDRILHLAQASHANRI